MNVLNIVGRLGGDAEVRFSKAGKPVGQFSVAVDSGWGDNKKTNWVRCTVFGDRAEKLAPYILKGDRIGVTGELEIQEWENDKGKGFAVCCIVRDITLLGEKRDGGARAAPSPQPAAAPDDGFDDDIPF